MDALPNKGAMRSDARVSSGAVIRLSSSGAVWRLRVSRGTPYLLDRLQLSGRSVKTDVDVLRTSNLTQVVWHHEPVDARRAHSPPQIRPTLMVKESLKESVTRRHHPHELINDNVGALPRTTALGATTSLASASGYGSFDGLGSTENDGQRSEPASAPCAVPHWSRELKSVVRSDFRRRSAGKFRGELAWMRLM